MSTPYQPQPGYPPQPPQGYYQPQQPQFAPPPGYPPQGYAPVPPGYAPTQQYGPPPTAPAPQLARGTIEDFLNQAGGGAASVTKFFTDQRVNGHWLQLVISRDLLQSDVRQQTDNNDRPATDRAGNPKFVLVIPVNVLGSSDGSHQGIFTEGVASVWIKGVTKDGLLSAMSSAGIQRPDEALLNGKLGGAQFTMISAGTRAPQKSGYSATKLYNFQYVPNGREMDASPATPTAVAATPPPTPPAAAPAPSQQYAPAPPAAPPAAPAYDPAQYQQAPPPPPNGYQAPAPAAAPAAPPAPPAGYAPAPQYAQQAPPPPPQGYAPQDPAQFQGQQYQQAPQGYAPPPAPPAPPMGYAPPADPEKAALLQKLQGQGG